MNPEDVNKLLDDVVPTPPSTKGWAGRASGRVRRRRVLTGTLAAVVALGVPIGLTISQQSAGPVEATPRPAESSTAAPTLVPAGEGEVTGDAMIIQLGDAPPNLCMGPIFTVYPPSCSGPTLKGEFSWDGIAHTAYSADGPNGPDDRRWTETNHTVVGHFDPDDGEHGSFTLTRPVTLPPTTPASPESVEYPALCEDPLRGGDPTKTGIDAMNLFTAELAKIPTIGSWVSNGLDFYNVLVPGGAEAVHTQLRTVWGGELCVETSDAPTEAERLEVLEGIRTQLPPNRYLGGSGGTPLDTVVELEVTVEDDAVRGVVESRTRTDIEVRVHPVFTSFAAPASPTPDPTPGSTTSAEPTGEVLRGRFAIYEDRDTGEPYLCDGNIGYSLPPICGRGPTVKGEFSWADVEFADQIWRWTDDEYLVEGHYDPDDGEYGSFTLLEPPALATEPVAEVPGHAELAELCTRPGATSSAGVDGIRIQLTSVFDDDLIENLPWEGASIDPSGGIGLRTSDCAPLIGPVTNADLRAAADDIAEAIPESFQGITALSVIDPDSPRDPEVQVLMGVLSPEWLTEIRKAAAGSGPVVVRTLLTPVGDADVTVVVP